MLLVDARREFDFAKARYVRSVIATEIEGRYAEMIVKRKRLKRALLDAEIDYREADEARTTAIRAYALRMPHRVNEMGIHKPSFFDRFGSFSGAREFYANAHMATARRRAARDALKAAQIEFEQFERMLEAVLAAREKVIERRLSTEAGLRKAIAIDPLLAMSHRQLVSAANASSNEMAS